MEAMVFTLAVFHWFVLAVFMSLLNSAAPLNMPSILVTAAVFQLRMLPLVVPNFAAPSNMFDMSVTLAVFHWFVLAVGMSWSKIAAPSNMEAMVFTLAVFHWFVLAVFMSLLNSA